MKLNEIVTVGEYEVKETHKGYRVSDRVAFKSEKEWRDALPDDAEVKKDEDNNFVAQASNKEMTGIAGRFFTKENSEWKQNTGWIYSGFMK